MSVYYREMAATSTTQLVLVLVVRKGLLNGSGQKKTEKGKVE